MRMKARGSQLEARPHKAHVRERYETYGLSAVRLIEEIRPLGYTGSIDRIDTYFEGEWWR